MLDNVREAHEFRPIDSSRWAAPMHDPPFCHTSALAITCGALMHVVDWAVRLQRPAILHYVTYVYNSIQCTLQPIIGLIQDFQVLSPYKTYNNNTQYTVTINNITRSHSSVTSVVRATRQVNGRRQICPSHHTHTP